ncbi:LysM peptidoglycan-binding domain-containing protein [Desulfobacterales bacterium HSG16]|nr:LysM peptidoglycan-binding domain-containing protein [Desulfobacterales bacterium HSG16]
MARSSEASPKKSILPGLIVFAWLIGLSAILAMVCIKQMDIDQQQPQTRVVVKKIASTVSSSAVSSPAVLPSGTSVPTHLNDAKVRQIEKRLAKLERNFKLIDGISQTISKLELQVTDSADLSKRFDTLEASVDLLKVEGVYARSVENGNVQPVKKNKKLKALRSAQISANESESKAWKRETPEKKISTEKMTSSTFSRDVGKEPVSKPRMKSQRIPGHRISTGSHHEVSRGETLGAIGRAYNIDVDEIRELNQLALEDYIYPGQKLRVRAEADIMEKDIALTDETRDVSEPDALQGKADKDISADTSSFSLYQISRRYMPSYGVSSDKENRMRRLAPGLAVYSR